MNTYEITFTRENGSTGKDRITAANEKQARKDFREIYRHSSATITDVIVAAENVPASKQQERDALDQIRAIVDTLGPDSYLATAFAGCFEDAEENIKNDFACSMKQRLESAEAKRIEAELGHNRLVDKLAASEKALEAARADIEKKDEEIAALNARISAIQRPTEPAEISDELLTDLATFSSMYIERIQKAIIENAGQIAKNATLVRLLHQYSTRLEQERTATGGLRIAGKMDTFIKLPEGETLPENIVSLTGITDERLQTEGVQPVKAAGQIAKLMQNGPTLMIAHNAQFDACFLRGLLRGQKVGRIDWLDSLTVYKDRRAYPHKLANTIIAYDLTGKVQNSHRAIDDVLALFEVLKAMDDEREDLGSYVNLFGYNPKYGVSGRRIVGVRYEPQSFSKGLTRPEQTLPARVARR